MILTGVITDIFHEEKFGDFRKRVIWLEEMNAKYPQVWFVEFWNNDMLWLQKFRTGDAVNCTIAVMGKKRNKNGQDYVFNTIRCVKIEKIKVTL